MRVSTRGTAARLIAGLGLIAGLAGCATATPSPTLGPTPSAPATTTLTEAGALPTTTTPPTAAPTSTPDVPFSQTGPWVVFRARQQEGSPLQLWAANEDGTALRLVVMEPVGYFAIRPLRNSDGQVEVAYVTFSDEDGRTDLTLKLLTLPDGNIRMLTRLTTSETGWTLGDTIDTSDYVRAEISNILGYETRPVWSPDGQWLAFGAALDGPSIDVYSYQADTDEIRRLTSGPKHANNLLWSRDNRYIVHTSIECMACAEFTTSGLWAARPDGSGVVQMEARVPDPEMDNLRYVEQIAPDVLLAATFAHGGGALRKLRLASLSTGTVRYFAPDMGMMGLLSFPSVDAEDHIALIYCSQSSGVFTQEGWYLVDEMGQVTHVPDANTGWSSSAWDSVARVFVVDAPMPYGITPDGKIVEAPPYTTYPSPDGRVSVLIPDTPSMSPGIWISREDGEPVQVLADYASGNKIHWAPDSQAFIVTRSSTVLAAHAPDFIPVPINGSLLMGYWDIDWQAAWTP